MADELNLETSEGTTDGGDAATSPDRAQARWKLKVRGEELIVDSEAKAIELMQKGAAYDQLNGQAKEEKRLAREERQQLLAQLKPLIDLDAILREDPSKQAKVRAIINDEPLPVEEEPTDDPYMREILRNRQETAALRRAVERSVGNVGTGLNQLQRNEKFRVEERQLRRRYGEFASDDRMDSARDFAERSGVDLTTAFRATHFDELSEHVRQGVLQEYEIDPVLHSPTRSEAPVLEGLGPLTDDVRARINSDPDLYGRFRETLRKDRQRRTGKLPLPR